MATVQLEWAEVTTDTSGNYVNIDGYRVFEVNVSLPVGDPAREVEIVPDTVVVDAGVVTAEIFNVDPGSYTYGVAAFEGDEQGTIATVSVDVNGVPAGIVGLTATAVYD